MTQIPTQHYKYLMIVIVILQTTTASPAKNSARPVFEVINEQPIDRIDDFKTSNIPSNLPYGNPLAGNSLQNARLHAQNQQAMFNAERVRQHRAQLQRWASIPPPMDSYMRAYHESQESHQLELEKQQAVLREKQHGKIENQQKSRQEPQNRQETLRRGVKVIPEVIKLTKADAVLKTEKSRNHRSYGSVENHQYLQPKMYKTIYVSPAPTYDQGVTIKPNGNNGLEENESFKLYTEAGPSKTHYIYPKQYNQMQNYESAQDIATLNSLLKKNPHDQLSELNALIASSIQNNEAPKELDAPIDLYFYMKNPPAQTLNQYNEHSLYGRIPPTYTSAYTTPVRDHTPITEEVDDIEDPNKNAKVTYGAQSVVTTEQPEVDTTTVKSNNYYKVEVASQTITSGYKPSEAKVQYYLKEHESEKPQALAHVKPIKYYKQHEANNGDESERYLHHNAQHTGVQHLTEDGKGVSAYGEDNLHYAANYEFGYRVRDHHSGNDFGHAEAKNGEATNGHYHVLLPDGRMQKVKYSAGPSGFHADITYDHLHK